MLGITKHAHLHLWTRDVGQLNRATETLVLLWIIILQTNLKFNSLGELPILLLGIPNNLGDCILENLGLQLTAIISVHRNYLTTIIYLDGNTTLAFQLSLPIGRIVEGKNCRIINHNKQTKLIYLMCRDNRPNLSHIHFHYVNELTAEPNSERIRLDGLQMGSNPTQPIACCSPTLPKNLNQAPTPTCSAITTPTRKI